MIPYSHGSKSKNKTKLDYLIINLATSAIGGRAVAERSEIAVGNGWDGLAVVGCTAAVVGGSAAAVG